MTDKIPEPITLGGMLERALQDGYRLDLKTIFQDAWKLGFGVKTSFLLASAFVMALMMFMIQLMSYCTWLDTDSSAVSFLSHAVLAAVLSPVSSGLDMMGVRRALFSPIRVGMLFDYCGRALPLFQSSLLMSGCKGGLVSLAMHLHLSDSVCLLLLVLFNTCMLFTTPLVLERGLSPARAMLTSLRLFLRGWPHLIIVSAVLTTLFVLAMLPLGLGLIWMVPFYWIVNGIIYRDVCGIRMHVEIVPTDAASLDKGSFVA